MTPIRGAHVETLLSPVRYTPAQLDKACIVAHLLDRGLLILVEPPQR